MYLILLKLFLKFKVELSTHDSKGITMKDIYLAKAFDSVYQQMKNN
jgi:pterin-4a-carbinolamine dehydratase